MKYSPQKEEGSYDVETSSRVQVSRTCLIHFPECVIYNTINIIGVMSFRKKPLYISQLIMPPEALYPVSEEIIFKFMLYMYIMLWAKASKSTVFPSNYKGWSYTVLLT